MGQDLYRTIGVILACAIAFMGFAAGIHLLVSLPIPKDTGAEWIASIGTVGTLAGTIWLATAESRNRRNENLMSAQLHAASMVWRIATTYAMVTATADALRKATIETVFARSTAVEPLLDSLNLCQIGELLPLVPLRGDVVSQLVQANDQVGLALTLLRKTAVMKPVSTAI